MTVYLDASSLVKLYVSEPGSDDVRQLLATARSAATSGLTYAEARAAFARRFREKGLSGRDYAMVKRDFDADWPGYVSIDVSAALCRSAGELAERHQLKSLDAIHLASAQAYGCKSLATGDRHVGRAAELCGLVVHDFSI